MIVLVDFSALLYAAYGKNYEEMTQNGFLLSDIMNVCEQYVFDKLRSYEQALNVSSKRVILCVDGYGSWRQEEFQYYKVKRKEKKSSMDTETLGEIFKSIQDAVKKKYIYIQVDKAEGDDVIAVLSELNDKITVISADKDLLQLTSHRVKIYHPFNMEFVEEYRMKSGKKEYFLPVKNGKDAMELLKVMILKGDNIDSVPNILSEDDSISNPFKKQNQCGYKKILEVYMKGREYDKIIHENRENFKRNKKMIDLSEIPEYIRESIISEYNKQVSR